MIGSILAAGLLAAAGPRTLPDTARATPPDSVMRAQCPGYTRLRVASIVFAGNAITKDRILRAELDFREGDTLTIENLARRLEANRRRLFNLQLFHTVGVQTVCRDGALTVLFGVQERWYTFPVPIFSLADRNIRSWLDRNDRWRRVDYGVHLVRYNFRGRNELLRGNLQLGFNQKYEVFFENPGARYRPGLALGASLTRSRALDYQTRNDRLLTYRAAAGFAIRREYVTAGLRWRNTVQRRTALDLAAYREWIADSVRLGNPDFFRQGTTRHYLDLRLTRTFNQRNTFAYPLTGRYLQLAVAQRVYVNSNSPAFTTLFVQAARYWTLPRKLYYSLGLTTQARLAGKALPYADTRALGYTTLVRGYDRYVIDGNHYAVVQQGLSYPLLATRRVEVGVTDNPKFSSLPLAIYLNTFVDAGYVAARQVPADNRFPNHLLASAGLGVHLVTYYDRVLTLEYTRTVTGGAGFYVRTEFPI
ncbi:BamA/TamA family outer membrane protein [Hymenobacter sp. J193]|uniref:BamA/TamA family outer membrane protein n=1 Tax=Hymenobacter sp. J193 TaxID=2898429 RepID=UPI002150C4FB|nr:BamA/TamA family outer membrane protein [Hymenobacter sp. J193]MCR5887739.1 BamA/TamA family outer membrane protein [Hymenobacter sp. J193]